MCVCNLSYAARKAHAPCGHMCGVCVWGVCVWCVWCVVCVCVSVVCVCVNQPEPHPDGKQ